MDEPKQHRPLGTFLLGTLHLKGLMGLLLLAGSASHAAQRGEVRAIAGRPFGIGSVVVQVPAQPGPSLLQTKAIEIRDEEGRVFYPAYRTGLLPGVGQEDVAGPRTVTIRFLFTGDGPLDVTVVTTQVQQLRITPVAQPPRMFRRMLTRWWRDYNAAVRGEAERDDYPQLVHFYLTAMLANRLGLDPPLLSRGQAQQWSELQQTVQLLAGAESLRRRLAEELMTGAVATSVTQSVPANVQWLPPAMPSGPPPVPLEAMAEHVPAECFYVRFGNFANYLWLSRLLKENGGDIGRMVTLRGQDTRLNERLQNQLALRESKLAEIFGGQVISDVALIGHDFYLAEGAAIGVLFQARNNLALSADLQQQRNAAMRGAAAEGASLEQVEIAGRQVSLLATPDNRLRSYYAVDGDFHLVTTSHALVARFFEAGQGSGALADSVEFQHARQRMPLDREDAIFAYFSSNFFQSLVSSQYQIELRRRLQADAAIQLIQLARLAAAAEGLPDASLDELTGAGFLPTGFGRFADGSGPIVEQERVIDSRRGARGSFTPIPDVPLTAVSAHEADWLGRVSSYFEQNWEKLDPLMVGIQRLPGAEPGRERIIIEANVSPLAEEKYGWILSLLGPPSTHEVAPAVDDIISMQAMLKGGLMSDKIAPHHLFLGVKDAPIAGDIRPTGFLQLLQILRNTPGYLGAWPNLGFLDRLPLGLSGQPDLAGFSPLPLGAWRWQGDGFSVVSFRYDVLEQTVPQLRLVPTDNPSQIRLRVGDLSQSQLAPAIHDFNYQRAYQASLGNVRLLNTMSRQFRVPAADAKETAEKWLDSQMVCALGGDYEIVQVGGIERWRSTAWPAADGRVADFEAPLLAWFRGLRLDLIKEGERLVMKAELAMERTAAENKLELPFLNLLGGRKSDRDEPQ